MLMAPGLEKHPLDILVLFLAAVTDGLEERGIE